MATRRDQRGIEEILKDAWGPVAPAILSEAVDGLWRLLRSGGGEEPLLERLEQIEARSEALARRSELDRIHLVRNVLRLGVRPRGAARKLRAGGDAVCTICDQRADFCWGCACGFRICQSCTEENRWGLTCNNITWECPDCGAIGGY